MLVRRLLVSALLLAAACSGAMAVQTLNSASGYVLLPDANVLAAKAVQLSAAYTATEGTSELNKLGAVMACHGRGFNLRAIAGLGDKAEVGVGWQNVHKSSGDANAFTIAAKARLMEKPEEGLTLAGGLLYRAWNTNMTIHGFDADFPNVTTLYLVLDKSFPSAGESGWVCSGSIGLMYDHFTSAQQSLGIETVVSRLPIDGFDTVRAQGFVSPFIGARATKAGLTILGEYKPQLKKEGFFYQSATWSLAARKEIKPGVTATAGFTNFNIPYTDADTGWFVDISYALPK